VANVFDLEKERTRFLNMLFPKRALPTDGPSISEMPIETVGVEPTNELFNHLADLRIYANLMLSVFATEPDGNAALAQLRTLKQVMQTYYYDPKIWGRAQLIKRDPELNEYEMAAAMCFDEAKFMAHAHSITGDPGYIYLEKASLEESRDLASEDSSQRALACMVIAIINRKHFAKPVDIPDFKLQYEAVSNLWEHAGGKDRKNAATWMYTREMWLAGKYPEAVIGAMKLIWNAKIKSVYYPLKEIAVPFFQEKRRQSLTETPISGEFILIS